MNQINNDCNNHHHTTSTTFQISTPQRSEEEEDRYPSIELDAIQMQRKYMSDQPDKIPSLSLECTMLQNPKVIKLKYENNETAQDEHSKNERMYKS